MAQSSSNRAILLTPPGAAAIAVIRLSGPAVVPFLRAHFNRDVQPGWPIHADLTDGQRTIDDPVVVLSSNGNLADISAHGGAWVIRSVLDLACRHGFEIIENPPIPLAAEAVDAETELETEVLMHLPLAKTELALRVLLNQPRAWKQLIENAGRMTDLSGQIRRVLADRSLYWLLNPPHVAIIGAPNVGKSTLANQLFAQDRSITADLPGTTRDWVGEYANIDGLAVMLVDTPGLCQTDDVVERQAIDYGREQIRRSDMLMLLLDATQALAPQLELRDVHPEAQLVVNKCDRPPLWDLGSIRAIAVSALSGQGIDQVRSAIRARFGCEGMDPNLPHCWTDRQKQLLERAEVNPGDAAGLIHEML